MFLGQENWAGRGQQQQKWQQQGGAVGGYQQQQTQRSVGGASGEVGQCQTLTITGCNHDVVGPIIRGEYHAAGTNHGKPSFKKEGGSGGQSLVVMIYFWDERDGAANSGWWIGPQIGGNMVWGHHPNRTSSTPPTSGWQAPHSAPADATMVVAAKQAPSSYGQGNKGYGGKDSSATKGVGKDANQGKGATPSSAYGQGAKGAGKDANKTQPSSYGQQQSSSYGNSSYGDRNSQQSSGYGNSSYGDRQTSSYDNRGGKGNQDTQKGSGKDSKGSGKDSGKGGKDSGKTGGNAYGSSSYGNRNTNDWNSNKSNSWGNDSWNQSGSNNSSWGGNQTNQMQQRQQQLDEQRKKMEEVSKNRVAEQQRKMEAQKKQQEELAKKRAEDLKKQQAEQKAAMTVRRIVAKLKTVNPENFEALKEELAQTLAKEFENCGSQKPKIQEESDKALEAASAKVDQIKETRKKNEERQKEFERKRQEMQEKAKKLMAEFVTVVDEAEEAVKEVQDVVEGFATREDLKSEEKVAASVEEIESAIKGATDKSKAALDFLKTNGNDMKALPQPKPEPKAALKPGEKKEEKKEGEEEKKEDDTPTLPKLSSRASAAKTNLDKHVRTFKNSQTSHLAKAKASEELKKIQSVFSKYDKDRDGMLSRAEITAYARGEFSFTMPKEALDLVYTVIVADGAKGVKKDDFQRLRVSVGIARERTMDVERKKEREAKEAEIAAQKEELKKAVEEVAQAIKDAESDVKALAERTKTLPADGKTMKSTEMIAKAEELEETHKATTDLVTSAQEKITKVGGEDAEIAKELTIWLSTEKRKLTASCKSLEVQLNAAKTAVMRFKEQGAKRDTEEVKKLSAVAMGRVKAFQTAEKLKSADLFKKISKDAATISSSAYVAFMKDLPKAETEKEEDADLTEEDLERVFKTLDEDGAEEVSSDIFESIMRVFMKVAKDIAITDNVSMKEGKVLRRLEIGEVVEVLEGPVKDEKADVFRVFAKSMNDSTEGWITMTGNQGSAFLKEGGGSFKVVKETIMTETFDIEATKEEARKIKETTRKLKVGEFVEVREWGRKQEGTGLTRMKCKARNDGMVGWVTTVGNTGIKFVEVA